MLKSLRRKLALAYALMAGIVLALVAFACLRTAEAQLLLASDIAFESGVNAILYKLQSEHILSQAWLSQSEAGARQIIYIEEGGIPLSFHGAWTPLTSRDLLIEQALAQADVLGLMQPLGSLEPTTVSFVMPGTSGERYRVSVALIPDSTQELRVAVIKDQASEDARMHEQRRTVLLLAGAGLLLIVVSGWLYSARAVKPAEESRRRQVEFIALASHELKAPLSVIAASADALVDSERGALIRNIQGESLRMARLVDDLLLLSRADAKTWSLRKERIDLDTLLIECYELYRPVAQASGRCLSIDLPDHPLPAVYGDAERLMQAVSIVLDNALTYTPSEGCIELCARAERRRLLITVTDDGQGIPDEEKTRIFDRFYRSQVSHTDRNHAGLGLSVAHELMQLHGGRIVVADAIPHGARFTLELPADLKITTFD